MGFKSDLLKRKNASNSKNSEIGVEKRLIDVDNSEDTNPMKSLSKVFVALLLAVTIALGGFSGNAHAQSPVGANINVGIDVNKTIDQILGLVTSTQDFQMVIANQTSFPLVRVGSYNDLSNWPLGDVPPLTAQYRDWRENGFGHFSFGANYAIGDSGKYFQFAASLPTIGKRKINLCSLNDSGNVPAKTCWRAMDNANDKNLSNGPFTGRATMRNKDGRLQWIYQVK